MARPKVLLVDDEPEFLVTAEAILGDRFDVVTSARPEQALEMCVPGVDVVCADFRMPGTMDGLTLLEGARRRDEAVGCILITGFGELTPEARDRLDVLGAMFLRKPFDPEIFVDVIANLADAAVLRRLNRGAA